MRLIKAGTSKARNFVCRGKDTSAKAGASEGASGATADLVCCFQPEETGDIKQHVKETYIEAVVVDAQGCNDTSEGIAAPEDPMMEAEQEERSSLLSTAAFLVQHLIITTLIMVFLAYTWPVFLVIGLLAFLVVPVAGEIHDKCSKAWAGGRGQPIKDTMVATESLTTPKPQE